MATPKPPSPSLQLVAIFSRHRRALQWARDRICDHWGDIALVSQLFEHAETKYYQSDMGCELLKQLLVLADNYDPARLTASKLQSNDWELELATTGGYPEARPLNIDPGYLTVSKVVLASAKDRAHRIYLNHGIYAEECLYYLDQSWQPRPWTYPDYRRPDFHQFLETARDLLKQRVKS